MFLRRAYGVCVAVLLSGCVAVGERQALQPAQPAGEVVVLLLQPELELEAVADRAGGGDAPAALGLGLATAALTLSLDLPVPSNPARQVFGWPPGELDFSAEVLAGVRRHLPAALVAADAKFTITDSLHDYFRLRAAAAPRPTLGLMLNYALSADLQGLYLGAVVDYGVPGAADAAPEAHYSFEFAQPGGIDRSGHAIGDPHYWGANRGARLRASLVQAADELGQALASDFLLPLEVLPEARKLWFQSASGADLSTRRGRLLQDRGDRLLLADGKVLRTIDRAQLD